MVGINSGHSNNSVCDFHVFFWIPSRGSQWIKLVDSEVNSVCKITEIGNFNTDYLLYLFI